eukprot:g4870.t1
MMRNDELGARLRLLGARGRCVVQKERDAGGMADGSPRGTFSVCTYNLLADCYVRVPGQPWNAFPHCDDESILWGNRRLRIQEFLETLDVDAVMLQEVEFERNGDAESYSIPQWIRKALARYTPVMQLQGKDKVWRKNAERNFRACGRRQPTGIAIFYRTNRWSEYRPSKHGAGSGVTIFLKEDSRDSPARFAIGSVHLVGDPSKMAMQIKSLASQIKGCSAAQQDDGAHIIIGGDFNNACEGEESDLRRSWSAFSLSRVCTGPTYAGTQGMLETLDHVLFSPGLQSIDASTSPTLGKEELAQLEATGLPNKVNPSDHLPVMAAFHY